MSIFQGQAGAAQAGDLVPAGTHTATLVAIIDLGTQDDDYQGTPRKARKLCLAWEITSEDGRPVIARDVSLSFSPKAALRALMEKWRGKGYQDGEAIDVAAMLGRSCLLSVVHKTSRDGSKTYAKIDGVSALAKGMPAPAPKHAPVIWEIGGGPIPAAGWLPFLYGEPLADVIKRSPEWAALSGGNGQAAAAAAAPPGDAYEGGGREEEIPF